MKKTLSLMLTVVMVMSLLLTTSCTSTDIEKSNFYDAIRILEGDIYTIEMSLMAINMGAYRQGDSFLVKYGPIGDVLIIDRKAYDIDHENELVYFSELTEEEFEKRVAEGREFGGMINLEGAKVTGNGREDFTYEDGTHFPNVYFEAFVDSMGLNNKAYFDENDMLIGIAMEGEEDSMVPFKYVIRPEVPDGIFVLPEGYEVVEAD
jgi:hypothetical protein